MNELYQRIWLSVPNIQNAIDQITSSFTPGEERDNWLELILQQPIPMTSRHSYVALIAHFASKLRRLVLECVPFEPSNLTSELLFGAGQKSGCFSKLRSLHVADSYSRQCKNINILPLLEEFHVEKIRILTIQLPKELNFK
jgi:hypothetical protein